MADTYHVALLIETSRAYGRNLCQGVARFAREQGNMVLFTQEQDIPTVLPAWMKRWRGDGILARIHNRKIAEELKSLNVPIVDLLCREPHEGIPALTPDAQGIADQAVNFFTNAGFEHFAFCGYPGISFSERRQEAFVRNVEAAGFACNCYEAPRNFLPDVLNPEPAGNAYSRHLLNWVKSLPKPVALFACNDVRGQRILSLCAEYGIDVPEKVSVMGVDNDEILCNLTNPPLSSIDPNAAEMGYRAAALLEKLMAGGQLPNPMLTMVLPKELVERTSTDTVAVNDALTARAIRFIRLNAPSVDLTVEAVLREAAVSRTSLDKKFHTHLGRSLSDEILRVRLQRVRGLLRETDLSLVEIARRSGFLNPSHMCAVFRRSCGRTPGDFRRSTSH